MLISSWCVPTSTTVPRSSTTMRSAPRTVDKRCAITSVVRPAMVRLRASCTCCSVPESSADVASSKIRIRGSFSNALAMATRCFCPPDSMAPESPTSVSKPPGSTWAKSLTSAASAATVTSA
mmetsp:Transcript_115429/g.200363  ORF Transcript_115429/g.200363 Transcript_115429/m.200363 type:complete len:122 (-) Transcript_115429:162-527(-)